MKLQKFKNNQSSKSSASSRLMFGVFGRWSMLGLVAGGLLGYVFYTTIGCHIEACTFISNPYINIIWASLLLFVVFEVFRVITIDAGN
jgi:hypothetical protein